MTGQGRSVLSCPEFFERMVQTMKHANANWTFNGTKEEFIDLVRWAMVLREMKQDGTEGRFRTANSPAQAAQMAERYGITPSAVLNEMKRIVAEAEDSEVESRRFSFVCPWKMVMLDAPYLIRKRREKERRG